MTDYTSVLTEDLLLACNRRQAKYDRENTFFTEDFNEIKATGYLLGPAPEEFGGQGLALAQSCAEQRKLAYYAPATALGINMHIYWLGIAADLWRSGDKSLEWMFKEAVAGEVFSAGHSERGNDLPVFLSTTTATKADGGYIFNGHKMFGSLGPAWTRYGFHGMDAEHGDGPQIIHAFMPRGTEGATIVETWDTMGMRATRSDDVILKNVFVEDKYISRTVPAGQGDPFVLALFAWALFGFASIYSGVAKRAIDLVLPDLKKKTALAVTRSMAYHPEVQHNVAAMQLAYDTIDPVLDRMCQYWTEGADYGHDWPAKIVSTKYHAVETCWKVVDIAMDLSGGAGMFKSSELERLFRDARCGRFHPANANLVHEIVAKTALGIDLGEQPRWG